MMSKNITEKELMELARQKKNEYAKAWKKANPDKVRKHMNDYWKRVALKDLEEQQKA